LAASLFSPRNPRHRGRLRARSRTAPDCRLGEQPGKLTLVGDEPALVGGLDAESLAGARAVFLAGSAESSRQALELLDSNPALPSST